MTYERLLEIKKECLGVTIKDASMIRELIDDVERLIKIEAAAREMVKHGCDCPSDCRPCAIDRLRELVGEGK